MNKLKQEEIERITEQVETTQRLIDKATIEGYKKGHIEATLQSQVDAVHIGVLAEKKRCAEIAHQFKRDARKLSGNPQWRHASEQYAKRIAKAIEV